MRTTDRRCTVLAVVIAAALVAAGGALWSSSSSIWTDGASNGPSTWKAGTVTFGANTPATALVSIVNVFPGSFGSSCVLLTYTGSLSAPVHVYLAAADLGGTGLGTYLTLRIREGTGAQSDCSDFVATSSLYNPTGLTATSYTLAAFSTASHDYATGAGGAWTASPSDPTRTYRFDWQVQDKNAAESLTAIPAFTWEAQTT